LTTPQVPSVGRDVHYVSHGTAPGPDGSQAYTSQCRAAKITEVPQLLLAEDPAGHVPVGLFVMTPNGTFHDRAIPYDGSQAPAGGTWHWPERVG
jgi:hypothetical protein